MDCDKRSLFDIVWSCFSTIFLCAWVTVHPNLPHPREPFAWILLRRSKILLYTFLVPELTVLWAMGQWLGAKKVAAAFAHRGWNKTHGFFLIMGGFHLHRGEDDLGVLSIDLMNELNASGDIEFPSTSESEIQDRSKGDILFKSLAAIQVVWFIVQCIARGIQDLAITELELLTLALASVNGAMFFFWWSKPLDVQAYIPVYLKSSSDFMIHPGLARANQSSEKELEREINRAQQARSSETHKVLSPLFFRQVSTDMSARFCDYLECSKEEWESWSTNRALLVLKWGLLLPVLLVLLPMMELADSRNDLKPGSKRVPTFYVPYITHAEDIQGSMVFGIFGVMVGGIHLVAWNFPFPSSLVRTLWRASSLIVTCTPLLLVILQIITTGGDRLDEPEVWYRGVNWKELLLDFIVLLAAIVSILIFIAYIAARLILAVEAIRLLKDMPPSTYIQVEWTRFIPHIS